MHYGQFRAWKYKGKRKHKLERKGFEHSVQRQIYFGLPARNGQRFRKNEFYFKRSSLYNHSVRDGRISISRASGKNGFLKFKDGV